MSPTSIAVHALLDRLEFERRPDSVLAFDGDGTLWSGDVGEDLYVAAIEARLIHDAALPALRRAAEAHSVESGGTTEELALRLFREYQSGRFPERVIVEVMTYCYAGWDPKTLAAFAAEAFERRGLDARINRDLVPILDWARDRGLRTVVVSASPRAAVETAARSLGFGPADIASCTSAIVEGRIGTELSGTIPYAEGKPVAARELFGTRHWLAAFGDNGFDLEMLKEASVPVAVQPKPALRERLGELFLPVLLE